MNQLELIRLRSEPRITDASGLVIESFEGCDYVAAVVDGESVAVRALRDGVGMPSLAIPLEVVMPPSRHWLGEPVAAWSYSNGAVCLAMDSEVDDPLPNGLRAIIEVGAHEVTWRMLRAVPLADGELSYGDYRVLRFDRARYEAELEGLGDVVPLPWNAELRMNREWWAAGSRTRTAT